MPAMTVKEFLQKTHFDKAERTRVVRLAGTTVAYLYQLAGGHRTAGAKLAQRLEAATAKCRYGKIHKSDVRPDLWPPAGRRPRRGRSEQ